MPNYYLIDGAGTSVTTNYASGPIVVTNASFETDHASFSVVGKTGIHPKLYFSYVKSKFKLLERKKIEGRLKALEDAFNVAVENGQEVLGEKIMTEMAVMMRESIMFAKGIKSYVERDDLMRYKKKIRDGHISDTKLVDFTRVIPSKVLAKKKELEGVFDDYVIFHYWDEDKKDVKKMTRDEKEKMKDPVLFGIIRETNRLYFVADWEDEYCDLTFDEMVKVLGKQKLGEKVQLSQKE
jgi:hypothetical protein